MMLWASGIASRRLLRGRRILLDGVDVTSDCQGVQLRPEGCVVLIERPVRLDRTVDPPTVARRMVFGKVRLLKEK